MKKIITALGAGALIALTPVAPAMAQDLQVVGPNGGHVGTVIAFDTENGLLTVKTDKHEIVLPKTSFTPNGETMMIAMTQAQLNAEVDKAAAELAETVSIGRDVRDADLVAAGTIEAMTADAAMIRLTNNTVVAVPLNGITPHLEGAILGYRVADLAPHGVELTPEQVQEQVAAAAEAAAEAESEADASAGAPAAGDAAAQ